MMRASRLIRSALGRVCTPATIDRLIDPILVDIDVERAEALRTGRRWAADWVVLAGYATFCRVLALYWMSAAGRTLLHAAARSPTLRVSLAVFAILTLGLTAPPLVSVQFYYTRDDAWILSSTLLPQAIPLALPLALVAGVLHSWTRRETAGWVRTVILTGIIVSVASLAVREWIIPAANQAFRVAVTGASVPRGLAERPLSELVRPLGPSASLEHADARAAARRELAGHHIREDDLSFAVHQQLALCISATVLALLGAASARARRRPGAGRFIFLGLFVLYVLSFFMMPTLGGALLLTPPVAAWLPTVAAIVGSLLTLGLRKASGGKT